MIEYWKGELEIRSLQSIKICISWIKKTPEQTNKQKQANGQTSIKYISVMIKTIKKKHCINFLLCCQLIEQKRKKKALSIEILTLFCRESLKLFCQESHWTSMTMIQFIKAILNSKLYVRYLSAIFVTPPSKTKLHCVAQHYAVVSLHFRPL